MRYIKLYEYDVYDGKLYFIDRDIDDNYENIFIWKFIKRRKDSLVVEKLWSWDCAFGKDELINCQEEYSSDYNTYILKSDLFNIIFESNNFDEVYEQFMMIIDAKKYNL